jgi:hypothetical protein
MTWRRGSLRSLASSHLVSALAWLIFASLSARCQSRSAARIAACPIADRQAAFTGGEANDAIAAVSPAILKVRGSSSPELGHIDLHVRAFRSSSDYFRTRFSLSRFLLLMPMRYFVDVNPALLQRQAPSNGTCAIMAHEFAHVVSLSRGNRIRRLGLIRLISERSTVKFERGADLEAIHRVNTGADTCPGICRRYSRLNEACLPGCALEPPVLCACGIRENPPRDTASRVGRRVSKETDRGLDPDTRVVMSYPMGAPVIHERRPLPRE